MATEVTDGIWHIDCRTRDKPNVFLVDDGDVTLVDAGWPGDEATLRTGLDEAGYAPSDVDRVLLTHYDPDHVGTLARITPDLDAPVLVHQADAPYEAGEDLPPWTARQGIEALLRLYYERLDLPELPIRRIEDDEQVRGFRAHHTPGHTPGHTVYVHDDLDAAFLGDLDYTVGGDLRPSGRITSYDTAEVRESLRTLLERVPEFEYACPGHGPPLENGYEELTNTVR